MQCNLQTIETLAHRSCNRVPGIVVLAVLNVPRDASGEAIRRAYRNLATVYHPDRHTGNAQENTRYVVHGCIFSVLQPVSPAPNGQKVVRKLGEGAELKPEERLRCGS